MNKVEEFNLKEICFKQLVFSFVDKLANPRVSMKIHDSP